MWRGEDGGEAVNAGRARLGTNVGGCGGFSAAGMPWPKECGGVCFDGVEVHVDEACDGVARGRVVVEGVDFGVVALGEPVEGLGEDGSVEGVFPLEVAVEECGGGSGVLRDGGEGDGIVGLCGEGRRGRGEEGAAPGVGVEAPSRGAIGARHIASIAEVN